MSKFLFLFDKRADDNGGSPKPRDLPGVKMEDESDSLSSAEEDDGKRRTSASSSSSSNQVATSSSSSSADKKSGQQWKNVNKQADLQIFPLSELKRTCPYTLQDTNVPMTVDDDNSGKDKKKGKGAKAVATTDQKDEKFYENVAAIPERHYLFEKVVSALPHVNYAQIGTNSSRTLTQSELSQHYRDQLYLSLPVSNAFHENTLLVQAGKRTFPKTNITVDMPPCVSGDKCEGMMGEINGLPDDASGYILTSYMFPEELKRVKETGIVPLTKRHCVLCLRVNFYKYAIGVRAHKQTVYVESDFSSQIYRNPVTGQGAYKIDRMLTPSTTEFEGFLDLIVQHDRSELAWVYDANIKLWRIDQTNLIAPTSLIAVPAGDPPKPSNTIKKQGACPLLGFSGRSSQQQQQRCLADPRDWLLRHYESLQLISQQQRYQLSWSGKWDEATPADNIGFKVKQVCNFDRPETLLCTLLGEYHGKYASRFAECIIALRHVYLQRLHQKSKSWSPAVKLRNERKTRLGHEMFVTALCQTAIASRKRQQQQAEETANVNDEKTLRYGRNELVWEGVLKRYTLELTKCSFWRSLESRKDPITLMISKCLPQRCQNREMGDTALSKFAAYPEFEHSFRQWIDCSLLGLYSHSKSSIGIVRKLEYFDMIWCPERHETFHSWLLKRQDLKAIFITREYLMFMLPHQPALHDSIRRTFGWDRFVELCTTVSDQVRQLIDAFGWAVLFAGEPSGAVESALIASAALLKTDNSATKVAVRKRKKNTDEQTAKPKKKRARVKIEPVPDPEADAKKKEEDPDLLVLASQHDAQTWIDGSVPKSHESLLYTLDLIAPKWKEHTYKKMPRNYRRMLKLLAQPNTEAETKLIQKWHDEDDQNKKQHKKANEDLQILGAAQECVQELFYYRNQITFMELVHSSRNKVPPTTPTNLAGLETVEMTDRGITKRHFELLSSWIDRLDVTDVQCESKALQLLLAFGMPDRALQRVRDLKTAYETRLCGRKPVVSGLRRLKFDFPYSYALLHSFSYLFTRHVEFRLFKLSAHYVENQISAIRGRFNLREGDPIPDCAIQLIVCPTCDCIYSLYNDEKQIRNPHECFGYNYVTVEISTGDMFCSREGVIAHSNFKSVKLNRIMMLGNVLQFRRQLWILCPQPKCGMPCVIDPQKSVYNEYGYACSWCTLKAQGKRVPRRKGKKKGIVPT